jgi:hypothetical protein
MLIDIQAPPSDENISIRQPDPGILTVFRRHLSTNISPFPSYLRKGSQVVAETPPSGEDNFIRETESNFIIVVRLHFLYVSHRLRVIREKTHRL